MSQSDRPQSVEHLEALATALRNEGVPSARTEESHTLRFPTVFGPDAAMFVRWAPGDRLVLVSQSLPLVVPPGQEAALAAVLLRVNQQLDMVGLLADPARGAVWLRTHLYTDALGRLDYPLFLTVVAACIHVVRERLAEVCVAVGRRPPPLEGKTPADAQEQALHDVLRSFSE